jgi:hypothetical protein
MRAVYGWGMKYLTSADVSVLVSDEAADIIIEYAGLLAETGHADTVTLSAIGNDGDEVTGSFVLGSGTNLMAVSTRSTIPEPDNTEQIAYIADRIKQLTDPPHVQPESGEWPATPEFE